VDTGNRQGRIITFYSYKGGTGRSMALANVAWLLAAAGKRVLMIDWDLEAPGLHRYVHPFLEDPDLTASDGVIDYVISYVEEASAKTPGEDLDPKWFAPYANITRFAIPLDYEFPGEGSLDFIPAGRQGPTYAGRVNSFNWGDFYLHLGGRAVLKEARERIRELYDFTFIDSRTGVSDTSGICTVELPHAVAVCFTLNMQSVGGAARQARSMQDQRPPGDPLSLFPVAMRLEWAEKIKTDVARKYAQRRFLPLMSDSAVPQAEREKYWLDVEVPYIAFYAFEEQLAYFLDPAAQVSGVLGAMKRLAWRLTGVDVRDAPGPAPDVRDRIVRIYSSVWLEAAQAPPPEPEPAKSVAYFSSGRGELVPDLPAPPGSELVFSKDLPRTGSWMENFDALLRRTGLIVFYRDDAGLTATQQRELAVALHSQSRGLIMTTWPTTGVPGLAPPGSDTCPYPGPRPFETEDCLVFFGHEAFVDRMGGQLASAGVIVLGGKPGTGKTSAIRAGLIPSLLAYGSSQLAWKTAICDLTRGFTQGLADALVRARGGSEFDFQREQEAAGVVTRVRRGDGPAVLSEMAASALSAWPPADRIALVVEPRTPSDIPLARELAAQLKQICFIVVTDSPDQADIQMPTLSKEDLIRAIEQPALRAGIKVPPGLAARIAADLERQEDSLALLQFLMVRLWEMRQDGTIAPAAYEAIGGVGRAVEEWAEGRFKALSRGEQEPAEQLLCRMVGVSPAGAYQPQPLASYSIDEPFRTIATKLAHAGLVAVEGHPATPTYSLFHPALALRWPRLKDRLAQNADFLRWREGFQVAVQAFSAQGAYSALLSGDALAAAQKWREVRPGDFTPAELDFIDRSQAEADALAAQNKRLARSNRIGTIAGISGAAIGLLFAAIIVVPPLLSPSKENAGDLITQAESKRGSGDIKGAVADLNRALSLTPDDSSKERIYSDLAYCAKLSGDWKQSVSYVTRALSLQPSQADKLRLLHDRAYAYLMLRDTAGARADYHEVLKLDPKDASAIQYLGPRRM
jgi:tetratricopeptide (TPR) repeat protein